ncbi:MAG: hypothetical protein ACE37F_22700 [Nannocystaceae bacterium]|nr:hypothetical protein [bacterium]
MKPRVVGYGSCGRAPPSSITACFESFDHGSEAFCIDVCETSDGVLVACNRRTLRLLAGWPSRIPGWAAVEDADLGEAFGGGRTRHRVLPLEEFLDSMGPLPMHVSVDGPLGKTATRAFERIIRSRMTGDTTVLARPHWLSQADLPEYTPLVAVLQPGEDSDDLAASVAHAVAMPARSLVAFGRTRMPRIALACDTRAAIAAARGSGAITVHTERPAWFRAAWIDDPFARVH